MSSSTQHALYCIAQMANIAMTGILEKVYSLSFSFSMSTIVLMASSGYSYACPHKDDKCICFDLFEFVLQMTGKDKDYRYMATSDLLNELNKENFKADADLEIKLSNIIIQQLDDVAGDVSGLAVKWYDICI